MGNSKLFKRTKILATIGPAVDSEEKMTEIILAGVDGCRFNCSHGSNEERARQLRWLREIEKKKGYSVAAVQDLQGPKIRLGILKDGEFVVNEGDELILDSSVEAHDGSSILPVQYNLASKVKVGEPVFFDDGKIQAEVLELVSGSAIKVRIKNGGVLLSRKGINLPDTDFDGDILTDKDLMDIEFGAKEDFDYVALSFVQTAEDIENLRQILLSHGSSAQIIAKIETKKAIENIENLEAIVAATDGVMVARGDMAIEAGAEIVPIIQRKLVGLCRRHAKLCIVATEMMASMEENPSPTRAEVSDVAIAVIQGADAVMLSGETATGKYPLETVKAMQKVILYTQNHSSVSPIEEDDLFSGIQNFDITSLATAMLAKRTGVDMIVSQTATGAISNVFAAQRLGFPIVSVTGNKRVAGQLALAYGNIAFVRPYSENYGIDLVKELKQKGFFQLEDGQKEIRAVIVSGEKRVADTGVGALDTIKFRSI